MSRLFILILAYITTFELYAQDMANNIDQEEVDYWVEQYYSVSYPLDKIFVTSKMGMRNDPFTGKRAYHNGLDLRADNEYVLAMFNGIIETVASDGKAGNYMVINHGDYTVSYCHLSKALVKAGTFVSAGEVVAVSGNSGRSTGPHLHITCRYRGKYINPYTLLQYVESVKSEAADNIGIKRITDAKVDTKAFIDTYAIIAMEQQRKYGIPSSVILAQMALESKWGTSSLARLHNNFFGIKCSKKWLDSGKPYVCQNDDKPNEKFCSYNNVVESIDDHSRLLKSKKYKKCHKYKDDDHYNWLRAIKASGYATDKNYVSSCESIIKKYRLYLFDKLAKSV